MTNTDYKELPLKEQDIAVEAQAVPASQDCRRNKLRKLALLVVTFTLVVCTVGYFGGCSGSNNTRGFSAEEVEGDWVEDGGGEYHHHHHGHHGPHPHGDHHHHMGDHHHDHPEGPPTGVAPRKGPKGDKGPGPHHHHHSHSKSHPKGHSKSHHKSHHKGHHPKSHSKSHHKGRHHHGDHHHHHEGSGFGLMDFFGDESSSSSSSDSSSSDSSSSDSSSSDSSSSSSSSEDSSSSEEEFDEAWEETFEELEELGDAEEWVSEEMSAMWEDGDEEVSETEIDAPVPEPAFIEEEPITAEITMEAPVSEPALIVDEVEEEEPYTEQEIMAAMDTNDNKEVSRLGDGN